MNRIMLVDDEDPVREKIAELIKRSGLDLVIAAEARNGKQAIEQLNELQGIDIIITDVRMPVMDGLSLIETVKAQYPRIKFAIISGYAEFEYAKRAMTLGVLEYILKPVKRDNLLNVLSKIISELNEEENIEKVLKKAENKETEYKKALLEKHMSGLMFTSSIDDNNSQQFFDEYPEFRYDNFSLILIHINKPESRNTDYGISYYKPIKISICNIIKEITDHLPGTIKVDDCVNKNEVIVISGDNNMNKLIDKTDKLANNIYSHVNNTLGLEISIGVDILKGFNIKCLYQNAAIALNNRFVYENRLYNYSDSNKNIAIDVKKFFDADTSRFKLVQNYISNNNLQKLLCVLKEYVREVFSKEKLIEFGVKNTTLIFIEFANFLSGISIKCGMHGNDAFNSDVQSGKVLSEFDSVEDIVLFFDKIIENILLENDFKSIAEKASDYVKQNYQQDLSLTTISKIFMINSSYFSRSFKDEMGINFIDYVTNIKVEKAKELLSNIHINILDVAMTVGYNNQQYFNKVFKKSTGVTPSEYRNFGKNSARNK